MNHGQGNEKQSSVKLSADGQTMTINSIVYFMTATPYHVEVMKKASTTVTEVWQLSNDGKTMTVQANAKSNIWDGERSWKTVFVRAN
jgi:ABC-type oligopeptide transport system substrate-binding subunit